jgi:hypothetical protein
MSRSSPGCIKINTKRVTGDVIFLNQVLWAFKTEMWVLIIATHSLF